ncbi:hypothetical protein MmiAt1_17370 [Methanimicrococcus sp. At1]|uniref:B-block binding subunit of TFIIIC domain-containing protein n=1 Tax=Methanimicrococcus hacksteinii TaxID=3028293 RepID=A0ABU3VRS3_9EURY|nr:hypothetical protein [Methanimicrococcus sp. At1]MDV0446122.1 hypothetical protein [Methanimicrococcus sp. At1]
MSATVKKESTKKKSTKSAEAEAVEVETANAEAPAKKTAAKPAAKPAAKTAAKPAAKPAVKTAAKPAAKPAAKTAAKPAAKPASKTAAKSAAKTAEVIVPEPAESEEEPVTKTRGRKSKATEEIQPAEEAVKKTTRKSKTTEAAADDAESSDDETGDAGAAETAEAAPKRKYTRRKKADDETAVEEGTSAEIEVSAETPVKKPGRKSKKEAEPAEPEEPEDIETQTFNLIKNTPGGIYQNEIWKQLNIDSRKCSRVLKKLLDSGQIIREEAVAGGTKTYLLKTAAEERKKNYDVLLVKGTFSPCTGCMGECRPEYCPALTFWIMNIHDKPEELYAAMGYNSNAEPDQGEHEMPPEFLEEMEAGEYEFDDDDDNGDLVFE